MRAQDFEIAAMRALQFRDPFGGLVAEGANGVAHALQDQRGVGFAERTSASL